MSYTHFTLEERKCLQQLLSEGRSFRTIAAILERSPSTISREVKRNSPQNKPHRKFDNPYWYHHVSAQNKCNKRRKNQSRQALKPETAQWDYIIAELKQFWSPEQICNRWHKDFPDEKTICVSTVYRYIKQKKFPDISTKTHLRRKGKKIQTPDANYNTIHPDRIIPEWPEEIKNRNRIGDWEGDTVYGGVGKGLLITMVDRLSRYLHLYLLASRNAALTETNIEKMMKNLPVKSISLDNGAEFAEFKKLEEHIKAPIYFAEPHKPWQRGTNENTNDIVRFFFPKGFDFTTVTEEDVQLVEDLINNRPRKCLGWKTPKEVFTENCVALG